MLKKITFISVTVLITLLVVLGLIFFLRPDVQKSVLGGETVKQYMQQQQQNVVEFQNAVIETISSDVE